MGLKCTVRRHDMLYTHVTCQWCTPLWMTLRSLQWSRNERDGVSNHRCLNCLPNRVFRGRPMKTLKHRVDSPHKGPVTLKKCSFWWRHHILSMAFQANLYRNTGLGRVIIITIVTITYLFGLFTPFMFFFYKNIALNSLLFCHHNVLFSFLCGLWIPLLIHFNDNHSCKLNPVNVY